MKVIEGNTFIKRLKGLKNAPHPSKLILKNCRSVHTFGMKMPIKIECHNKKGKVIETFQNVPKNRIIIGPKDTHSIIEYTTSNNY